MVLLADQQTNFASAAPTPAAIPNLATGQANPEKVTIGSWQGPIVEGDLKANIAKVKSVLDDSKTRRLDFLCFPECYLSGYLKDSVAKAAVPLTDPAIQELISFTGSFDTVVLVGMAERTTKGIFNSQLVLYQGKLLGLQHKTILVPGYDTGIFITDLDLKVFEAKGIKFGIAICHATSFPEPALYLRYKGARLLFTPHFNNLPPGGSRTSYGELVTCADHRTMVLNNQAALATLLKMVVVRSNITCIQPANLGWGDSNIWNMDGVEVAAGKPFTECVVTAEFEKHMFQHEHWIDRRTVPAELCEMISRAAKEYPR